jgi:hypothetical protein
MFHIGYFTRYSSTKHQSNGARSARLRIHDQIRGGALCRLTKILSDHVWSGDHIASRAVGRGLLKPCSVIKSTVSGIRPGTCTNHREVNLCADLHFSW